MIQENHSRIHPDGDGSEQILDSALGMAQRYNKLAAEERELGNDMDDHLLLSGAVWSLWFQPACQRMVL
jgi:hypothetical protein